MAVYISIVNDTSGTEEIGNYDVYLTIPLSSLEGVPDEQVKVAPYGGGFWREVSARVEHHVRADGWEALAHRAVFALSSSCNAKIEEPEPTPLPPSHDK